MSKTNWALKIAAAALISASVASTAYAEGENLLDPVVDVLGNNGKGFDLSDSILGEDSSFDFGGWVAAGGSSNSTGLFNSTPGFNVTQAWLYVEKAMDTEDGFDWGFRGDVMVGVDYDDTNSFGNNAGVYDQDVSFGNSAYGLAAPQLYVELGWKDFSVKGGKFYTPVGYEVVTAPDNFFYSHAFTMYNSEPFTHTGFLATYSGIDKIEVFAGWSAGWDTGFDQFDGGSNFLGGVSFALTDSATLIYTTTAGNLGALGDDGYTHSFVLDYQVTEKLNYVIQSDYTNVKDEGVQTSDTVGVNQYLFYTVNDIVSLGTRVEWWRTEDVDYYSATVGVNLKLLPNLVARPEFRYQFAPEVTQAADPVVANVAGLPVDQGIFGIDFIITF